MIGRLQGTVVEKQPPQLLLDVNGVGYELHVSMNTFYKLPELNATVILYTHLIVREDAQLLYAFYDMRERELFRHLIKISGVGPKLAITLLSNLEPDSLLRVVANEDINSLTRIPGIGKKTAERLMVEMRNRLESMTSKTKFAETIKDKLLSNNSADDAVNALIALGYKAHEASKAVSKIADANLSSEELIRKALQAIA